MKADLAIYTHVLGVPSQYKSVKAKNWILVVVPIGTVFANPVTNCVSRNAGMQGDSLTGDNVAE